MRVRARRLTGIAIVLVAAACSRAAPEGAAGSTLPTPTTTASPSGPSSSQPVAVPSILEFDAPLLAGGMLHGASLAGRDVAFWFWAPW